MKGWVEGDATREQVFEIAGDAENGATVDEASGFPSGEGFDTPCRAWTDPDFDPSAPAFYYARVLEAPTCRWSRYACNAAGVDCATQEPDDAIAACCDPSVAHTIQERAWTSPIFYVP